MLLECEQTLKTFFLAGLFRLGKKREDDWLESLKRTQKHHLRRSLKAFFGGFRLNPGSSLTPIWDFDAVARQEHLDGLGLDAAPSRRITDHEPWFVHISNSLRVTENVGPLQSGISSFLFYPHGGSQAQNALCRPPEVKTPLNWSRLWQGCSGESAAQHI